MIGNVASNLEALSPEQYVLAFVFLCSYSLALGQMLERRGRAVSAGFAVVAAVGFVARCAAWEQGIMVVAVALVGMGAFGAAAWLFWTLVTWRGRVFVREGVVRDGAAALDFADTEPALAPAPVACLPAGSLATRSS